MAFTDWVVQFTDTTEAGRVVRLNLNDPGVVEVDGDVDLGNAALERTLADVAGRDGAVMTQSKRVNREVRIPLKVRGDSLAFSTQMGKIARECDRADNLLEWWPKGEGTAAPEPVFFVASKGDVSTPVFEDAGVGLWRCELTLLCEPAALGAKVSGTVVDLSNDPASGQEFALPTIKGDIATPLSMEVSGTTLAAEGATALLATHVGASSARIVRQAEAAVLGSDTTVQANSTAMSGSGSNFVRTTFATVNTLQTRAQFQGLTPRFGTYKMLVRVRKTTAADVFDVRRELQDTSSIALYLGATVRYAATTTIGPHWLDLGDVAFPVGSVPPGISSGVVGPLSVQAQRITGTGSLDIDAMVLVPVDLPDVPEPALSLTWHRSGNASMVLGWDADADLEWSNHPTFGVGYSQTERAGVLPKVYPGYDNRVTFMRHVGTRGGGVAGTTVPVDTLSWTTDIAWSYYPRYLFVAAP